MEAGTLGDAINPWGVALFRTFRRIRAATPPAWQSAYDKWLDQTSAREEARTGSHPRCGWRHPLAPLARAVLHRRCDLPLHALLRRQRRGGGHAGDVDGLRDGGDRGHAAAPQLPGQPLPLRCGRPSAGFYGTHLAYRRRGARRNRTGGFDSLRRTKVLRSERPRGRRVSDWLRPRRRRSSGGKGHRCSEVDEWGVRHAHKPSSRPVEVERDEEQYRHECGREDDRHHSPRENR